MTDSEQYLNVEYPNILIRAIQDRITAAELKQQDEIHVSVKVMQDILGLLRKQSQKPVRPIYTASLITCPKCNASLYNTQSYCDECGTPIDWYI